MIKQGMKRNRWIAGWMLLVLLLPRMGVTAVWAGDLLMVAAAAQAREKNAIEPTTVLTDLERTLNDPDVLYGKGRGASARKWPWLLLAAAIVGGGIWIATEEDNPPTPPTGGLTLTLPAF